MKSNAGFLFQAGASASAFYTSPTPDAVFRKYSIQQVMVALKSAGLKTWNIT
jgi:hypothetical protein